MSEKKNNKKIISIPGFGVSIDNSIKESQKAKHHINVKQQQFFITRVFESVYAHFDEFCRPIYVKWYRNSIGNLAGEQVAKGQLFNTTPKVGFCLIQWVGFWWGQICSLHDSCIVSCLNGQAPNNFVFIPNIGYYLKSFLVYRLLFIYLLRNQCKAFLETKY